MKINIAKPSFLTQSIYCITFTIITMVGFTSANADAQRGESLSQTCLGCHGVPGLRNPGPVYNIPMIGGQKKAYLIEALESYKNKSRSHPTMQAQASSLQEQDINDISTYFSQLTGTQPNEKLDTLLISEGESLSKSKGCVGCHGATGDNDLPAMKNTAYIAGQYQNYITQALKDYRDGGRKHAIMSSQAEQLSLNEIKALSAWYASQKGAINAPKITIFK